MRPFIILAALLLITSSADAQYRSASAITAPDRSSPAISVTTTPALRLLSPDCDLDRTRGREAAGTTHSGSGWMAGGFVSGVLLGLIGTAISYAMASSSIAEVNRVPDGVEPSCYREGYTSKARGMNTSNALTGGLLGTAVLVLIVISATSSSSGY